MAGLLDYLKSLIPGQDAAPPPSGQQWPTNAPIQMDHRVATPIAAAPSIDMDAVAKSKGFGNAAQMSAFYQRQREQAPASTQNNGGQSLLDQALSIHPAYLLSHILDKWNKADGTTP